MFNIEGLGNSTPITSSSFINYKNINVGSIATSGYFPPKITSIDFSYQGIYILIGGEDVPKFHKVTLFRIQTSSKK
jgi:hypothetical protein